MQVKPIPGQLAPGALMNRRSSLRGSAFDCTPLIVTASSSRSLQTKIPDPMPELRNFIMDIKSELDPVEMKEDPQSEVAVSLDEEDQLSDADQPCEDLIPLSNDQVLLTNAQDPLTEVKVEEPELAVDETKFKVEEVEVTGPEVQVTWSGVLTAQGQDLRSANDIADLIRTQSQQIAKLTARCNHTRRQLNNMVQLLRRRDNTISSLRAERDELATCLAGRGGTGRGRIQIQSVNNTVEEKKPNRKLFIVKRVRKSFVRTHPTSVSVTCPSRTLQNTSEDGQETSENGQKTSELKRKFNIRENSDTGVKRSLNIVERSSLGILDKYSGEVRRTSKIQKSPVGQKQNSGNRLKPSITVKPISDIVKSPTLVMQPKLDSRKVSSVGVQRKSIKRQKPTITVKPISEIIKSPSLNVQTKSDNRQMSSVHDQRMSVIRRKQSITIKPISEIIENPSLLVQPLSGSRQISSVGVQSPSDNRQKLWLGVQPKPDVRQMSVGVQRTSDVRQNALVIQIDGMHQTVLQPTAVRLDDYKEMG